MLVRSNALVGCPLQASDGEIGKVKDLYFDDRRWVVRYFIVDTGRWLSGRKVLISPEAAKDPDFEAGRIPVALTRDRIADSPPLGEDEPVSRRAQRRLSGYYNWGVYWMEHTASEPLQTAPPPESKAAEEAESESEADLHLRSLQEVEGYTVHASGEQVGTVEGFLVQSDTWAVRYLVVDIGGWLSGRRVLISPA